MISGTDNTFLVTGGAGFIGSALVHRLISLGKKVINLDALTYAGNLENLRDVIGDPAHVFIEGSICDSELVDHLLATHQPRHLINVAAESHVDRSIDGPEAFVQTNIVGTSRLLAAARSHMAAKNKPLRYVQVSTDEVFGTTMEGEFREDDPYRPNSPYAASKAAADHLVRSYAKTFGMDCIITHGSNTYGPRQFPEKLIPLMTLNAIEGKALPIYGNGLNVRDWLFVEDHANGIVAAALQGVSGESYNIGGGTELENIVLVRKLCETLDRIKPADGQKSYAEQITFVDDRPGHDFRYALSTEKARSALGWQPDMPFEEGFEKTIRWYVCNSG